jgi:hypothetical protein
MVTCVKRQVYTPESHLHYVYCSFKMTLLVQYKGLKLRAQTVCDCTEHFHLHWIAVNNKDAACLLSSKYYPNLSIY